MSSLHRARRIAFAISLAVITALGRLAAAAEFPEEAVKAAFLHRFASYVEWPVGAADGPEFVIAVHGDEGVRGELARLLPHVSVQQRPARVVAITRAEQLDGVQVLFVGTREPTRGAASLLAAAASRPILVVTDARDGLEAGSTINFVHTGRKLRFEISLSAADRSGLRIQSDLLAVATRVAGARSEGKPK